MSWLVDSNREGPGYNILQKDPSSHLSGEGPCYQYIGGQGRGGGGEHKVRGCYLMRGTLIHCAYDP